mmetsp:Transcript_58722/g.128987  ORF Transcript_58722/g.128987 Transcript_58722/m.128987 type:complete len:114 (-) Transcript_58722:4-345(-)
MAIPCDGDGGPGVLHLTADAVTGSPYAAIGEAATAIGTPDLRGSTDTELPRRGVGVAGVAPPPASITRWGASGRIIPGRPTELARCTSDSAIAAGAHAGQMEARLGLRGTPNA